MNLCIVDKIPFFSHPVINLSSKQANSSKSNLDILYKVFEWAGLKADVAVLRRLMMPPLLSLTNIYRTLSAPEWYDYVQCKQFLHSPLGARQLDLVCLWRRFDLSFEQPSSIHAHLTGWVWAICFWVWNKQRCGVSLMNKCRNTPRQRLVQPKDHTPHPPPKVIWCKLSSAERNAQTRSLEEQNNH